MLGTPPHFKCSVTLCPVYHHSGQHCELRRATETNDRAAGGDERSEATGHSSRRIWWCQWLLVAHSLTVEGQSLKIEWGKVGKVNFLDIDFVREEKVCGSHSRYRNIRVCLFVLRQESDRNIDRLREKTVLREIAV